MKFPILAITFAAVALTGTSCQSKRSLAQFGNFRIGSFGQNEMESEVATTAPLASALQNSSTTAPTSADTPVISDTDPVLIMARSQAAGDTLSTPTLVSTSPSTMPATNLAGYAPVPPMTQTSPSASTSTLESAQDIGYAIPKDFVVKTTAYTHLEADSLQYGTKSALGDDLKFGRVRSAAADWSRYPVGTRFRIKGLPYEYVVDDYGSALVGTDTIDLYKPDNSMMDQWGSRNVGIEVLEWGSFEESKRILEGRQAKPDADHVRKMLRSIEQKIDKIPARLRDGFRA